MIFPPRNLPGEANLWGREIESRLRNAQEQWSLLENTLNDSNRATNGQLGATSGVIEELLSRTTVTSYPPNMSVTGSATSPYPRTSQSVTLPALPGGGSAFLTVRGVKSQSPAGFAVGYLFVRRGGDLLIRKPALPSGDSNSDPIESQNSGEVMGFRRIPVTANVPVTLDLEWVKGSGGASTAVALTDISITLTVSGVDNV